MRKIFLFGGTFDPPHIGHTTLIETIYKQFCPDIFDIIPSQKALVKPEASASGEQRYNMLSLALAPLLITPGLNINRVQLDTLNKPYTIDLLLHMRARYPEDSICFILGMDAFKGLFSWNRWSELLSLTHLMIVERKSTAPIANQTLLAYHNRYYTENLSWLHTRCNGHIFHMQADLPDISSSSVRAAFLKGRDISAHVGKDVLNYIQKEQLYRQGG